MTAIIDLGKTGEIDRFQPKTSQIQQNHQITLVVRLGSGIVDRL